MSQVFTCEMDGINYIWNGKMWYEADRFIELPMMITNKLDTFLKKEEPVNKVPTPKKKTKVTGQKLSA
ncbi:MAG: hypothetical protein RDV48_05500 [Candidatus Eremiobacteraeota bacterium]|nr:hypothetical protein [Candidatus Eremiobacteraeota bacterium]